LLGGAPAVWTTCMLFFQSALLSAYAFAHWQRRHAGGWIPMAAYVALLCASVWFLPIRIADDWTPPEHSTPIFWLLGLLFGMVGLPFVAVACTAPLLQSWFTITRHPSA